MGIPYLFVYGTLRSDVGHPMHGVLTADAALLGRATVPGELYWLREFAALVPLDGSPTIVTGEVYEITGDAVEHLLTALDEYEGIADPAHDEYRRDVVTATLWDGRALRAWAYVLNRSAGGLRRIASGDYRDSAPK